MSLSVPYSMFGLGRTNNYIETFFMGFPDAQGDEHYSTWSGMIPNSQILVFPYAEDKPSTWTLELVISPSDSVLYVIISLSACLVVLAAVIGVLHWKERQQDEAEKKKQDHFFTF
jgi:integrin alpha FG-GAP repeat containing protein 1